MIARKTIGELWPLCLIYLLVMQAILIPAVVLWEDLAVVGRKIAPILGLMKYLKTGLFKEVIESTANYEKYFAMQQFFKGGNVCGAAAAVLMGTGLIARERENMTLEFLVSRPISTSKILFHKFWVSALAIILPLYLVGWSGIPISQWLFDEELSFVALTVAATHNSIFVLSLLAITTVCSVYFRVQAHAAAAAGLFVVINAAVYLIQTIRQYSYFRLSDLDVYAPVLRGELTAADLFWTYQIWLLLGTGVLYLIADRLFKRTGL